MVLIVFNLNSQDLGYYYSDEIVVALPIQKFLLNQTYLSYKIKLKKEYFLLIVNEILLTV